MSALAPEPIVRMPETLPLWLQRELRSDHAGESGAVEIYRGILAVSRQDEVRAFATEHLRTETRHLRLMDELVPPEQRSRLTWLWRLAGWVTGALPALFGSRAVFRTIEAVETFVDGHYEGQIRALEAEGDRYSELAATLAACRDDEIHHRDDAGQRAGGAPGPAGRLWSWLVNSGSHAGVALAKRV